MIYRADVHGLLISDSSRGLMRHLLPHMNPIQLQMHIPVIQLVMIPTNTMNHHFQVDSNNKEVSVILECFRHSSGKNITSRYRTRYLYENVARAIVNNEI